MRTTYLRFAALGDSTTVGVGDPVPGGWRGWARLLAESLATAYDVSFCNLAVSGATSTGVLAGQLVDGLAHRPTHASLIVGVNDTMRSTWDPSRMRTELMTCAEALHGVGAELITARFHDHGEVFGLPHVLRRPLGRADRDREPDLRRGARDVRRDPARPGDPPGGARAGVLVGRPVAPVGARPPRPGARRTPSCCTSGG